MTAPTISQPPRPAERAARWIALCLALGLPLLALIARWTGGRSIELRGRMAETGGWTPGDLTVAVGEPLRLRLTSDDVTHGFAVGQSDWPAVDVKPGEVTETTLTFDRPGRYTFYCTRWCGPNHWRMRGTIEVTGPAALSGTSAPPLYASLGIDIDAPHAAEVTPTRKPSATAGERLGVAVPAGMIGTDYYRAHSPAQAWRELRDGAAGGTGSRALSDEEVWDLVAFVWQSNTTPEALAEGRALYAQNCAACHGETGAGDGVMAASLSARPAEGPADFTDAKAMLGASPALLQGKIIRGGMGTGMPYWGPIFTDAQTWALVDYLWTFQMELRNEAPLTPAPE